MPLPYFPAADSRHRRACIALYRALVRQGRQIPLPLDLRIRQPKLETTRSGLRTFNNDTISVLIRNAFRRNRKATAPRLVTLALKNGYRFLDLLLRAKVEADSQPPCPPQTPTPTTNNNTPTTPTPSLPTPGPIYTSILTFLRSNKSRILTHLAARDAVLAAHRAKFHPKPDHIPLLTLLPPAPPTPENPHPDPVYISTIRPRPLSEIKGGIRKVPVLDVCRNYPFLRLSKPQSPVLGVIVRNNCRARTDRIMRLQEMEAYEREMGRLEDEWEGLVEVVEGAAKAQVEGEGGKGDGMETTVPIDWVFAMRKMTKDRNKEWRRAKFLASYAGKKERKEEAETEKWWTKGEGEPVDWAGREEIGYEDSWEICIQELAARLSGQYKRWVARGEALWKIEKEERELAEKEARERGERYKRNVDPRWVERNRKWEAARTRRQVKRRTEQMLEAEERGDHETARRIAEEEFVVRRPRAPGYRLGKKADSSV